MASRMTMYFELGAGGWSESFYSALSIADAIAAGKLLATKRCTLMIPAGIISAVGARSLDNPRFSDIEFLGSSYAGTAGTGTTRDLFQAALYVRFGGGVHISKPALHGLPDEWMEAFPGSTIFFLNAAGAGRADAYLNFLRLQGFWQLRGLTQALTPAVPHIKDITVVSGKATLDIPGHTLVAGDKVQINSCKGYRSRQFNGLFRVESVAANVVTLSGTKGFTLDYYYVSFSGAARRANKVDYSLFGIDSASRVKVGSKKIGRPTFGPHGRLSHAGR